MNEPDNPQAELLAALGPHLDQVGAARLEVPPAEQARRARIRQVFEAEQRAVRAMLRLAESGLLARAGYERVFSILGLSVEAIEQQPGHADPDPCL